MYRNSVEMIQNYCNKFLYALCMHELDLYLLNANKVGFKSQRKFICILTFEQDSLINNPKSLATGLFSIFFLLSYHISYRIINRFFNSHHSFIINQIYQCLNRCVFFFVVVLCTSIKYRPPNLTDELILIITKRQSILDLFKIIQKKIKLDFIQITKIALNHLIPRFLLHSFV